MRVIFFTKKPNADLKNKKIKNSDASKNTDSEKHTKKTKNRNLYKNFMNMAGRTKLEMFYKNSCLLPHCLLLM